MTDLVSMPVDIVPYLKETINKTSGSDEARFSIYQLGRKWGKETIDISGERCNLDELGVKATLISVHSGLTNIDVDINDDIKIKPYNSKIEDKYFLAGYFSGIVSGLLEENYIARIEEDHYKLIKHDEGAQMELSKLKGETFGKSGTLKNLKRGESYLISEEKKNAPITFNMFIEAVESDIPTLCFTRIFPPRIHKKFNAENFPIFWMSNIESSDEVRTIRPDQYDKELLKIITSFLQSQHGVFMIHGIEFLISNNEFKDIFNLIQKIKDLTAVNDGIMLLPVFPKALDEKEFNNLKSELIQYNV
ncbi:MAG: DUF835 domain-containing protein [Thermoplasmatota archaeon]